jgi:hypothetical protein
MTAVTKVFNIDLKAQDFEDARVKFNEMTKLAEGMPAEDRELLLHQELRLEAFSGNKDRTLALARQMQAGEMAPVRRQFVVQSLLANPDLGPEIAKLGEEMLMKHPSRDSALCLSLRARARFLQGDKESAIALQQQALAAAPEEKRVLFEEELKNYRDGKLPPVSFTR